MNSSGQARFFCRTGALAGADYRLDGDATIGRGSLNTVVVPDGRVSKTHARLAFEPGAGVWFLEDLGSTNGTRLDGVPLSAPERLRDLHVVTLGGRHDFIFVALPGKAPSIGAAPHDADPGTRYEAPPALAVPPLMASDDSAAAGADGSPSPAAPDGPPSGSGTRHEPLSVLSVPPLVEGGGAPDEALPPAPDASPPAADESPSALGTRHEPLSVLSVPPLVAAGDAPEQASAGAPDGPVEGGCAAGAPEASGTPPVAPGDAAPGADAPPSEVSFEVRKAGGKPRRVTLGDGRHVFGRGKDCAVTIDDRKLSRRHAAFVVAGGRVRVEDLDSLNGTFVDEARIEGSTELEAGQVVRLGVRVRVVLVRAGS